MHRRRQRKDGKYNYLREMSFLVGMRLNHSLLRTGWTRASCYEATEQTLGCPVSVTGPRSEPTTQSDSTLSGQKVVP